MTNDEIKEAAHLLESLPRLRADLATVDVSQREELRTDSLSTRIQVRRHAARGGSYDVFLADGYDRELALAVLNVVAQRRRTTLHQCLRRLAQLGVVP